ncbi:MAG: phosphomannomutase [Parcubacteria group bacterium Gr01-1014_29]|nr:MAG: phosphomannomutase [Parcubacteria group bacterium Gr01-1014_29]
MNINPSIFKAYDIRGIYPDEITPEAAYRIGRAFAQYIWITVLNKERDPIIAVNADARASSPELKQELIRGLVDEKCRIIDCGLATTPLHYFAINHLEADGGVMVTASHNPAQYNGFKLSRRDAEPIGEGSGMEEIRNTVLRGIFPVPDTRGSVQEENLLTKYIDFLCSMVDISQIKKMRVVFDVGNGMVGLLLPQLLERLNLETDILFGDVDMTFPNHEANPLKEETLDVLKRAVTETKADLGVAFDGDGDRVRFVTPSGFAIPGDIMTAVFAIEYLKKYPGEKIVYTVNSSRATKEAIEEAEGVAVESRIGHALIKSLMRKENVLFGGEVSGHFYWREFFFAESALYSLLFILRILSATSKTLDELVVPLLRYTSSGEVNVSVVDKDKALDAVAAQYRDAKETKYIDGISIAYEDFWFNVRPSNTEPLLRITMEAKEKGVLDARLREVMELVTKKNAYGG